MKTATSLRLSIIALLLTGGACGPKAEVKADAASAASSSWSEKLSEYAAKDAEYAKKEIREGKIEEEVDPPNANLAWAAPWTEVDAENAPEPEAPKKAKKPEPKKKKGKKAPEPEPEPPAGLTLDALIALIPDYKDPSVQWQFIVLLTLVFLNFVATAKTQQSKVAYLAAAVTCAGALAFDAIEPAIEKPVDSLYLSVMTLTTIGYGDFAPATPAGRIFFVIFSLGGLGLFGNLLSAAAEARSKMPGYSSLKGFAASLVLGTSLFYLVDDPGLPKTALDSLYFSVVTGTTVGYGDHSPQTDSGKLAVIVYSIISLNAIADVIGEVSDLWNNLAASL